jgi:hypothetical protein
MEKHEINSIIDLQLIEQMIKDYNKILKTLEDTSYRALIVRQARHSLTEILFATINLELALNELKVLDKPDSCVVIPFPKRTSV